MAPNTALAERNPELFDAGGLPSLAAVPLIDCLRLIRTPHIGSITFFQLLIRYGSVAEAVERLPELAMRGGAKQYTACTREQAEREIERTSGFGARLIRYGEAEYPALLLHIPDPPPVIAVLGNAKLWQARETIAIVGARNASANGCIFAGKLAKELGAAGFSVISGLARGIDTAVHKASVATGTVAVIAGGIDHVYPAENAKLYDEIRARGVIISEQAFGASPLASSFPARNRIISGMSMGCVVAEASPKSGSLITARLANEQGRDVFAVPGHPLDPRAQGCNRLIKQGATLIESAADVTEALAQPRLQVREAAGMPYVSAHAETDEAGLTQARAQVLEKLTFTPVRVDELLAECQVTHSIIATVLIELELAGRVTRMAGNRVCLKIQDV